jgi:hypothetical protein
MAPPQLSSAEGGSGADGVMSSEEMVALMNNSALLLKSSTGGSLSKTGSGRDADGTIDRSPPPTEEVKAVLKELKRAIDRYGIDMTLEFRTQGATQYGTITKSRFNSIITVTFGVEKGFLWHDETGKTTKLDLLNQHYGTGATDIHLKGKKQVAWMDLCEDLGEIDASWTVQAAEIKDFGPSIQSMMLDAADGVIDGKVGEFVDKSSRGGLMGDHDGW